MTDAFGPWEYVEAASTDGQEWFGCGVAPIGGTEFVWLESSAERDIPVARLIAAAPELLASLKDCIGRFVEAFPAAETYPPIIAARAAIAKAEGNT